MWVPALKDLTKVGAPRNSYESEGIQGRGRGGELSLYSKYQDWLIGCHNNVRAPAGRRCAEAAPAPPRRAVSTLCQLSSPCAPRRAVPTWWVAA